MKKRLFKTIFILVVFLFIPITTMQVLADNKKIILIDPGHGGIDGGATSKNGTVEKDINLQISLKLMEKLKDENYQVYITRDSDMGLYEKGKTVKEKKREDLNKRVSLKTETNCDIFVSIHQNMFPQAKCYGAQVWYAGNDKSMNLANTVQESIKKVVQDNNKRVAKPAGEAYLILRDKYDGACILVECGFLSNPEEENKLKTDKHQELIVDGIIEGINEYFQETSENM